MCARGYPAPCCAGPPSRRPRWLAQHSGKPQLQPPDYARARRLRFARAPQPFSRPRSGCRVLPCTLTRRCPSLRGAGWPRPHSMPRYGTVLGSTVDSRRHFSVFCTIQANGRPGACRAVPLAVLARGGVHRPHPCCRRPRRRVHTLPLAAHGVPLSTFSVLARGARPAHLLQFERRRKRGFTARRQTPAAGRRRRLQQLRTPGLDQQDSGRHHRWALTGVAMSSTRTMRTRDSQGDGAAATRSSRDKYVAGRWHLPPPHARVFCARACADGARRVGSRGRAYFSCLAEFACGAAQRWARSEGGPREFFSAPHRKSVPPTCHSRLRLPATAADAAGLQTKSGSLPADQATASGARTSGRKKRAPGMVHMLPTCTRDARGGAKALAGQP